MQFVGSLSNARKTFNIVRMFTEFMFLKKSFLKGDTNDIIDFILSIGKRAVMLLFWLFDFLLLLQRSGILDCSHGYIIRPQMNLYLISLVFTIALNLKRHFWAEKVVRERKASIAEGSRKNSTISSSQQFFNEGDTIPTEQLLNAEEAISKDPEIVAASINQLKARVGIIKACCDMLNALNSSGIYELIFNHPINKAVIHAGSAISAFLSLYCFAD